MRMLDILEENNLQQKTPRQMGCESLSQEWPDQRRDLRYQSKAEVEASDVNARFSWRDWGAYFELAICARRTMSRVDGSYERPEIGPPPSYDTKNKYPADHSPTNTSQSSNQPSPRCALAGSRLEPRGMGGTPGSTNDTGLGG
jgi:hypothetical protein